jgi:PAS domain S-box-containing protein
LLVGAEGVVHCNQAALELLGLCDPSEIAPRAPWILLPPRGTSRDTIADRFDCGRQSMRARFQVARSDGTALEVEACWTALSETSPPIFVVELLPLHSQEAANCIAHEEREAAARYRAIVDASPDIIHCCNLDGRLTYVSPGWTRTLGHLPEQVVGSMLSDFVHPDDYVVGRQFALRLISNPNARETFDCRVRAISGEWRTVAATYSMIFDESGRPGYLVGIARDVTAQRMAEQAQRESAEVLTALVDASPIGVILTNDRHEVITANAAYCKILGATREEILSGAKGHKVNTPPEWQEVTRTALQTAWEKGRCDPYEKEYLRADGVRVPILVQCVRLPGPKRGLGAFVLDMTEVKNAQKTLVESEARYRSILDNSSDIILLMALDGTLTYVSPSVYPLLGLRPEDVVGRSLGDYVLPDDLAAAWGSLRRKLAHPERSRMIEYRIRHTDGTLRTHGATGSLIRDAEGNPAMLVVVSKDLTDRVQREQAVQEMAEELKLTNAALIEARDAALEASRAKGMFLANMSHEIRTPMNGVMGMTDLLLQTELTEDQRQLAETVQNSARSLLKIINDILDFSKIEAGRMSFDNDDFDLAAMIDDFVKLTALRAQEKGLEFTVLVGPDVPNALHGDPGRLQQILTNLVGNAVKFTERGEVSIRVSLAGRVGDEVVLRFEVKDTGIGISEDHREGLFAPFTQVDASSTRRFGGTGLGLSICKQLTEMMGGQIGFQSEVGVGSTFWFTIRLGLSAIQDDATARALFAGLRVLTVDDSVDVRTAFAGALESLACRHDEASGVSEALAKLRAAAAEGDPYVLAIVDWEMQDLSPEEFALELDRDPLLTTTRLVATTSTPFARPSQSAAGHRVHAWLGKPLTFGRLKECLWAAVGSGQVRTPHTPQQGRNEIVRPLSVLVAEDNLVNQKVARRMLEAQGHAVEVVPTGRAAVEALSKDNYDIVLMDIHMPEMDGLDAARAIRNESSPVLNHGVPIVALTASALTEDQQMCLDSGMNDFLAKPFASANLAAMLAKWAGPKRQDAAA